MVTNFLNYNNKQLSNEKILRKTMKRLGVTSYSYDWCAKTENSTCFVEFSYNGRIYRFTNSTVEAAARGKPSNDINELFGEIVLSMEGLANAVKHNMFTLDMLLYGVPSVPDCSNLPEAIVNLGFTYMPRTKTEVTKQYHKMAKLYHPDVKDGSREKFERLSENYLRCMELVS